MTLYTVSIGSKEYKVEIANDHSNINGKSIQAALVEMGERGLYLLKHGSFKREMHVQPQGNNQYVVNANGKFALAKVEKVIGLSRNKSSKVTAGDLKAPISGMVVTVNVRDGDEVSEGDVVLVLESMKMQMLIKAPVSGVISSIQAQPGAQVAKGDLLVKINPTV